MHKGCVSEEPVIKSRASDNRKACVACKKRKGRCTGLKPCAYCVERSVDCFFHHKYGDERRQPVATSANPSMALANLLNPSAELQWTPEYVSFG